MKMEILSFSYNGTLCGDILKLSAIDDENSNFMALFESVLKVKSLYYSFGGKNKSRLERIFAYELYHQWSKKIEEKYPEDNLGNREYLINAETGKNIQYFDKKKSGNKYPDMVLHKSMDKPTDQGIVCEFKRIDNFRIDGFKNDLEKLEEFVCGAENEYKFRYGFFLLINGTITSILKKVEELGYDRRNFKKRREKILLAAYKSDNLQVLSLSDALNRKEREEYIKEHENEK